MNRIISIMFGVAGVVAAAMTQASAQSAPTFIPFKDDVLGALYKPDAGPAPKTGIIVMHRESNYMANVACAEFAKRGFAVLCMNSRFFNNESSVDWELIPHDVAQGVTYLKTEQKVAKVVLYGSSGGGVTMSFYQAVAENGPSVCQGENKLTQCANDLAGLPKADAIILVDGHPGNPMLRLRSLNPALPASLDSATVNPALDPFDPKNGFNPNGPSTYSEDFKQRYAAAQSDRMNKLIDLAQAKVKEIKAGKGLYSDDAPFNIPGFDGARLQSFDTSIRHTTLRPEKLLKNDGTVVTQVIESVAPPRPALKKANGTFAEGARGGLTLKSFLSSNAIRSTSSLDESKIDLCSTNNSTACMLQNVSVPLLAAAMQASYQNLIQEVEINYDHAKTTDKEFIVVEGATTQVRPCPFCAQPREAYANVTKNFYDYASKWINARM
jgi:hypothetical protein